MSILPGIIAIAAVTVVYWLLFQRKKLLGELIAFAGGRFGKIETFLLYIGSAILFIAVWDILSGLEPEGINKIPSPFQVVQAFGKLVFSGKLLSEAWFSIRRILIGFTIASIVGVTCGLLAGSYLIFKHLIIPVNSFLRYIPPTAFISLLIVYFGIGEMYKCAVIFLGVIFFIIQMVVDVVEDVDKHYLEMGLTSGFSRWHMFKEVIVPFAWPRVFDVLRINLGAAWTFLVAAEIVGAEKGLGHLIAVSQRYLRIDDLFVGILTFGVIGVVTDRFLEFVSRKLFRWHYITLKR